MNKLHPILQKPKQLRVVEAIHGLARRSGAGTKLPTMQELSKALAVSIATLDAALQKLEARGVVERRQGSGIYVAQGALQRTVGLVIGQNVLSPNGSDFYRLLIDQCEKKAVSRRQNFSFFLDLPSSQAKPSAFRDDLSEAFSQGRLDGVLIVARRSAARERWIRGHGVPVVTLSDTPAEDTLTFDYRELVRLSVRALAERGCRRPALVGVRRNQGDFFREALAEEGLPVREERILVPSADEAHPLDIGVHDKTGRAQTGRLLAIPESGGESPDGIVVTDDVVARGVCSALLEAGIAPGRDLPIATHANVGAATLRPWEDRLVLVQFDPEEFISRGFDLLEGRMDGASPSPSIALSPRVRPERPGKPEAARPDRAVSLP